jgi:hypothetical protein
VLRFQLYQLDFMPGFLQEETGGIDDDEAFASILDVQG